MKKVFVISAIFAAISSVLIFFIVFYFLAGIREISGNLVSEEAELAGLYDRIEDLKKSQNFFKHNQADLEKIDAVFFDSEAPVGFYEFLEKQAENFHLSMETSSSALLKEKSDLWPFLSLSITLNGSFPDLLKFLDRLETSSYLIEISNLNIKRLSEKDIGLMGLEPGSAGSIRAVLSIKVYTKRSDLR